MLYNDLVCLDVNSIFDEAEFKKFLLSWTLFYNGGLTQKNYIDSLRKVGNIKTDNFLKLEKNLKLKFPDWIGIGNLNEEKNNIIKIYLSVDNNDLHRFANLFIYECLEKGFIDYDFKLNNNDKINRRDNVVIYCNAENFSNYVELVRSIIEMNPNLKFNLSHLLGISYTDKISVGIDFENGNKSWTDKICETIFNMRKNGKTNEEIIGLIEYIKFKSSCSINAIIDDDSKSKK